MGSMAFGPFCFAPDRYYHQHHRAEYHAWEVIISEKLLEIGSYATSVTGAAMALAIGYALTGTTASYVFTMRRRSWHVMPLVVQADRLQCFL